MSVIERVARAIFQVSVHDDPDRTYPDFGHDRDWWGKLARAAVLAMREPTPFMTDAVDLAGAQTDTERTIEHAWRAMIDAILTEDQTNAPPR